VVRYGGWSWWASDVKVMRSSEPLNWKFWEGLNGRVENL
jgi:hypothetical protein